MPTAHDLGLHFAPLKERLLRFAQASSLSENEIALLVHSQKALRNGEIKGRKKEREAALSRLCSSYGISLERYYALTEECRNWKDTAPSHNYYKKL